MDESLHIRTGSEKDWTYTDNVEDTESSYPEHEKKSSSYTRKEYILIIVTFTGQFFVNACVSLPAPFLPQIVSLN